MASTGNTWRLGRRPAQRMAVIGVGLIVVLAAIWYASVLRKNARIDEWRHVAAARFGEPRHGWALYEELWREDCRSEGRWDFDMSITLGLAVGETKEEQRLAFAAFCPDRMDDLKAAQKKSLAKLSNEPVQFEP